MDMPPLQTRYLSHSGQYPKTSEVLGIIGVVLVVVFGSALDSPGIWGYIAALLVLIGFALSVISFKRKE